MPESVQSKLSSTSWFRDVTVRLRSRKTLDYMADVPHAGRRRCSSACRRGILGDLLGAIDGKGAVFFACRQPVHTTTTTLSDFGSEAVRRRQRLLVAATRSAQGRHGGTASAATVGPDDRAEYTAVQQRRQHVGA